MDPIDHDLHKQLAELEEKIARKTRDLETQGVLHGQDREAALNLKVKQRQIGAMLRDGSTGSSGNTSAATVAAEIEGLRLSFARWAALIDKHFEKGY